jgi:HSP20 family protein
MAIFDWNPWLGLAAVRQEMDRLVKASEIDLDEENPETNCLWTPSADVLETAASLLIRIELPGVDLCDVAVETRGGNLYVYGQKRYEKPARPGAYQIVECAHGPFARKFALRGEVLVSRIEAVMRNGVLEITIPKDRPRDLNRRIRIS